MPNFRANKLLLISLAVGTVVGLAVAVGGRFVMEDLLTMPEDAVLISVEGAVEVEARDGDAAAGSRTASRRTRRGRRTWTDPIIRRNIFDSSKVGGESTGDEDTSDGNKTALPLILLATIVADPLEFSSALIMEEKSDEGSQGYGIGDRVLDEAIIHRILPRRVVIKRNDGTIEYLDMEGTSVSSPEPKKGRKGKWAGIEKAGDNKFVVDEDTFNKALENPEKLANSIRAVPHTGSDGKVDGFRLSGIRRSSLFNKLGIRNGDVVHTVNGHDLTSMQTAMEAYNSLQSERTFSFEITRRNKRQTFDYEVR